jgi:hypothetical protein
MPQPHRPKPHAPTAARHPPPQTNHAQPPPTATPNHQPPPPPTMAISSSRSLRSSTDCISPPPSVVWRPSPPPPPPACRGARAAVAAAARAGGRAGGVGRGGRGQEGGAGAARRGAGRGRVRAAACRGRRSRACGAPARRRLWCRRRCGPCRCACPSARCPGRGRRRRRERPGGGGDGASGGGRRRPAATGPARAVSGPFACMRADITQSRDARAHTQQGTRAACARPASAHPCSAARQVDQTTTIPKGTPVGSRSGDFLSLYQGMGVSKVSPRVRVYAPTVWLYDARRLPQLRGARIGKLPARASCCAVGAH